MKKKEKKNKVLVLFMLMVFVLSTVGSVVIYYSNGEETITRTYSETKYKFKSKADNVGNMFYEVKYDKEDFTAFFLPESISLEIDEDVKETIANSNYFYFTFDPNDDNVQLLDFLRFDIRNNLPASRFFFDSVTNKSAVYNLPLITCANSTSLAPVIMLKSSNVTKVEKQGSCITIDFANQATLQVRDSLVYILNGVEI
jgi:hypothetical protein